MISFLLLLGCQKEPAPVQSVKDIQPVLPDIPFAYADVEFPDHFNEIHRRRDFLKFFVDDSIATLGRVLFYDKKLSINNTISCASCHKQEFGFADPLASSIGFKGARTPRNSMAIVNPILNNHFFWDSRVFSAEQLALEPVQNHIEMGMESLDMLTRKLSQTSYYPPLFEKAFGSPDITELGMKSAIAQFLKSIVSTNTKFDRGHSNDFADFSPLELKGKEIFFSPKGKCSSCHAGGNLDAPDANREEYGGISFFESEPIDVGPRGTANIGLDIAYADNGLRDGQFKIPSLRNIALTAPYMHDGRFSTLEEVVRHYSSNIQLHQNLDDKFLSQSGHLQRLDLSEIEIQSLVAFLHTLTDEELITDPKYSDPFVE